MSLSVLRPTNISWVLVQGCVCPRDDAVCIRPEDYTKPVECLNAAHLGSFADHLLEKPCASVINGNNNNNNVLFLLFGATSAVPLRRLPSPLTVGRKLHAEMGIASGSGGGGGGLSEFAEKGGVEVNSAD
uniref:Uncharacterized protein n=1 Tax=Globodera pallida TaxID=36090 RepID=A0A183CBZ7_GLOPA